MLKSFIYLWMYINNKFIYSIKKILHIYIHICIYRASWILWIWMGIQHLSVSSSSVNKKKTYRKSSDYWRHEFYLKAQTKKYIYISYFYLYSNVYLTRLHFLLFKMYYLNFFFKHFSRYKNIVFFQKKNTKQFIKPRISYLSALIPKKNPLAKVEITLRVVLNKSSFCST